VDLEATGGADERPSFESFGSRLKWLLTRAGAPKQSLPSWLSDEFERRGMQVAARQTVRTWVSAPDTKQPEEAKLQAICEVLGANPAWLRYRVGWPYVDAPAEPGRGYDSVRQVQMAIAREMAGMPPEEVAAEAIRRGLKKGLDRSGMRKLYRWVEDELLDLGPKEVVTLEDAPQQTRNGSAGST
jgi:hypothetical protein